jgi:hypothetical protein
VRSSPLYLGGKRRPGPNLWGFDPAAPCLEPRARADGAHHINREAYRFWTDPTTHRRIEQLVPQLARRKRTGTKAAPVRRTCGKYGIDDLEMRERDIRRDRAEGICRLLAWCSWHSDWRTHRIGRLVGGKLKFQSRCNLADGAGFPVRVDDKQRVRAYRLDDCIEDAIAAGLLWRHEEDDQGARARGGRGAMAFKLTHLFYLITGVAKLREDYSRKLRDAAARDRLEQRTRRRAELQASPAGALVVDLAGARTNDSDFTANREEEAARLVEEFRARHGRSRGGGGDPPS